MSEGPPGCAFLGCTIRQYRTRTTRRGFQTIIPPSKKAIKKHCQQMGEVIARQKMAPQAQLILALGPVIGGWSNYYARVWSKQTDNKVDPTLLHHIRAWITVRQPRPSRRGATAHYWQRKGTTLHFSPPQSQLRLRFHTETPIKRQVNIQGARSPYDGDWMYWSTRTRHSPGVTTRVGTLLRRQQGRCPRCGLSCKAGDILEVDHIIPKAYGGKDVDDNWQLLHRHCHDEKTAEDRRRYA
jgi:RNA-directed DNA polymerase